MVDIFEMIEIATAKKNKNCVKKKKFSRFYIQKKFWELTIIDNKLIKLNFLKELKIIL